MSGVTDDELRDRLEVAMMSSARGNTYRQWADTILPTVRAIAKEQAAATVRGIAAEMSVLPEVRIPLGEIADKLRDRADALDPT